jgi:outer membrane protein TolC
VRAALTHRLDLQTTRDAVEDARRALRVARNNLLGDLDLDATVTIPTDPDRDRGGLRFDGEQIDFGAGITYRAPVDREIERLAVRQAEIGLARSQRAYERTRDTVTIDVRGAVRGIDSARFSLEIQESNVRIAENREASIEADPDRANVRQKTDAIDQTARARDARDSAARDLALSILGYLLDSGQLRVRIDGTLDLPEGLQPEA